jgi:hypothetical protein
MTRITLWQNSGRLACAIVVAAGLMLSVAAPTFASVRRVDLPDGTTCERVGVNFSECTTPDGTKYWCTDDGTCEKAPKRVVTGGIVRPGSGGELPINPGNPSEPSRFAPLAPVAGFSLEP